MATCILYARVSTRDKDQNPETQLYALREYAKQRGWAVRQEYVDRASALDMRGREEWRRLLASVRRGGFSHVLVTRLDRAFRSVIDTYQQLEVLDHSGIGFVSITQPIDTTTSAGKLTLGILAAAAEFERDIILERIHEGLARARAEGKQLGRPAGSKDKKARKKSGYLRRWSTRRENPAPKTS